MTTSRFTTTPAHCPTTEELRPRLEMALREDLGERGDVTSDSVFPAGHRSRARIVAKEAGVLCGGPIVASVFAVRDPEVEVEVLLADGAQVAPGDPIARLAGPTRSLLSAERLALNLLQRASGIASLTARYVEACGGAVAVCDTRKTTPLWRDVEKYAVVTGGGTNHRLGLYDMAMLKDTHADGGGGVAAAVARVRSAAPDVKIAAEARDLAEVREALDARADLIMLDNMDDAAMAEAIALIAGRAQTEVTGGVTLERMPRLAQLGVDRVSIGALTHSARAMDFSMRLDLTGS
ncbi:MAG: carboxylating nicotinate-nucleotide diphosphorylase [Sumerlaeia bacterium]